MSAGLSSTIRISGVFIALTVASSSGGFDGKREPEGRPATGLGFDPDPASAFFDNLFADGQPDSAAGIFRMRMQAPENNEHVLLILGCDANAVVLHREDPFLSYLFRADSNRGRFGTAKLDGVADEVLKYLHQLRTNGHYRRKLNVLDDRATFLNCHFQILQARLEHGFAVGTLQRRALSSHP